jgi:hypothetical protein
MHVFSSYRIKIRSQLASEIVQRRKERKLKIYSVTTVTTIWKQA